MKALTKRQQIFVEHYLSNGGHGRNAALSAGYAEKYAYNAASRLLKNPAVKAAIEAQQQATFAVLKITREDKLKKLWAIAEESYEVGKFKPAIAAIAELNKMQGDYAPVKTENTHIVLTSDDKVSLHAVVTHVVD